MSFFFHLHTPLSVRWHSQMWHTQVRYRQTEWDLKCARASHLFPITWFLYMLSFDWQHHDDDWELSQLFTFLSSWTRDTVCSAASTKYTQFNFSILFYFVRRPHSPSLKPIQSFSWILTRRTRDMLCVGEFGSLCDNARTEKRK